MPEVTARFTALGWQFRHDNTIAPLAPRPDERVEVYATSGVNVPVLKAALFYTTDGSRPNADAASLPMEVRGIEWAPRAGFITCWATTLPGQPAGTVVRYRIGGWGTEASVASDAGPDVWANDGQGYWFRFPGEEGVTTFAYSVEPRRGQLPEWMNEAVIYHIFLDRFHPGTPDGAFEQGLEARARHGGTLEGVRQALPYLVDLGVNCLWFSPLGPSETYHRYDTMDFFGVDPELGTAEDLQALVRAAHDRGIRIWLDFVPSHSSWHHPAFLAAQQDRSSPTYAWYIFDEWPHDYRSFLQSSRYLPSFNTEDPGARGHLIDAAVYWLREFDVDGYRIDHVIAAGMDFWVALRRATEAVKDDTVLVGEATDTPDCLRRYSGRLHGILDFPLARALRLTFGVEEWKLDQLDSFLNAYELYMVDGPGTVSFLDNHDMDRFLWVAGNDVERLKMAAICQFTLSATPVLYYGTEIGLTQNAGSAQLGFGGDEQARGDMSWDQSTWNHDLLSFYRSLIRLRRGEPALHGGPRHRVHLDSARQTYAYLRAPSEDQHDAPSMLVAFNLSPTKEVLAVRLPESTDRPTCLLSTNMAPGISVTTGGLDIVLAPMSAAILRV
jgi:glycosidase